MIIASSSGGLRAVDLAAQKGDIFGDVVTASDRKGVKGLRVELYHADGRSTGLTKTTGSYGNFKFAMVPFGDYYVAINTPSGTHVRRDYSVHAEMSAGSPVTTVPDELLVAGAPAPVPNTPAPVVTSTPPTTSRDLEDPIFEAFAPVVAAPLAPQLAPVVVPTAAPVSLGVKLAIGGAGALALLLLLRR